MKEGVKLAREGKVTEAIAAYENAKKLDPTLKIEAKSWNGLCWFGSIYRQAKDVLFACEEAVKLAPDHGGIRDSRGLPRALTGNIQGAIDDFQAFLDWSGGRAKDQRRQWIEALKKGEDPFTDEVLEELKNE